MGATSRYVTLTYLIASAVALADGGWHPHVVWIYGYGGEGKILYASGGLIGRRVVTARHVVEAARDGDLRIYVYIDESLWGEINKWRCKSDTCWSDPIMDPNPVSDVKHVGCPAKWIFVASSPFDDTTIYHINESESRVVWEKPDGYVMRVDVDSFPHFHRGMSGSILYLDCRPVGVLSSVLPVPVDLRGFLQGAKYDVEIYVHFVRITED